MTNNYLYFAIVTFGSPSYGSCLSFYHSLKSAQKDLASLGGGSMTTARIVGCLTRQDAIDADIADGRLTVIAHK